MAAKVNPGNFFEDFSIGQVITHAVPRTVTSGDRALYGALYPTRFAFYSSDEFARQSGFSQSPLEDVAAFHIVFGKSVPDISLNAVANLGYAEGRWLQPVYPGDTLRAETEIIGLKENSNGKTGIVYVRTRGIKQDETDVISFVRWVMVRKRDLSTPAPSPFVPELKKSVSAEDLVVPAGLNFTSYNARFSGEPHMFEDYEIGEVIDHIDGVTVEDTEHMMATRLWQNTAKVHFDTSMREDGKRLIYGGHVISMARALSFNGLANAQVVVALNGGTHANPCFAGDTIYARSEVLDKAELEAPGVGAMRLRLIALKNDQNASLRTADRKYGLNILLDLDIWTLVPRRT